MEAVDSLKSGYVSIKQWVDKLLEDVTEEESVQRGKDLMNHIRWQVGHLCVSTKLLVKGLGGDTEFEGSERYSKLFDFGVEFAEDPSLFPALRELIDNYGMMHSRAVSALDGVSADDLDEVIQITDEWKESRGRLIMFMTLHDAYHAGQIGAIRAKVLGRKGVFG
ncbi:MAG: DinB family protein [Candidatus Zixiibacteriota bacterium]